MTFLTLSLCVCTELIGHVAPEFITFKIYKTLSLQLSAEVGNVVNNVGEARMQCTMRNSILAVLDNPSYISVVMVEFKMHKGKQHNKIIIT